MKPPIFKDKEIQTRFDRDGYAVIDFISKTDTEFVAKKFYELHPELPRGFYAAAINADDAFKQEIYEHTEKIFGNAIDAHFENYKKLGSTYLCKAPGAESKVNVHQDWTTVDETQYYSATIWVPLLDTSEENGALRVLPGSHLFFNYYRSNNIPVAYRNNEELLWNSMTTVPMKAGQAFILNHAVLHGSSANLSAKERLVVAYALAPKDAKLVFYHKNAGDKTDRIEKFDMPDDFFQRYYNLGGRPQFGVSVKEFDYPVPMASTAEIIQLIKNAQKNQTDGLSGLIKHLFSRLRFQKDCCS